MNLTRELEQKARDNTDDPRVLLEILYDVTTWSDDDLASLQRWIIDQVLDHVDEPFSWPATEVPTGDGRVTPDEWPEVGLLGKLGYKVGKSGKDEFRRRAILRHAFHVDAGKWLPVGEQASAWGAPRSAERLQKIANSLAAFARNARKRSDSTLETAISHWETDLHYLKEEFYESQFTFKWPAVSKKDDADQRDRGAGTRSLFD